MSDDAGYSVNCYAHGCPMFGVATRSTTGSKEWICMIHMGAESNRWQAITAELRRLVWLVEASKQIRVHQGKQSIEAHRSTILRDLTMAQRSDLHQRPTETDAQWGIRLEDVLAQSCSAMTSSHDLAGKVQQ